MTNAQPGGELAYAASFGDEGLNVHAALLGIPTISVKRKVGGSGTPRPTVVQLLAMQADSNSHGARLQALRKSRKLTQAEAAAAIGVGRSTLASIEKGHDAPGRETFMACADFYGVTLDYLRGVPEPPQNGNVAKDDTEIALLELWREIDDDDRGMITSMLTRLAADRLGGKTHVA